MARRVEERITEDQIVSHLKRFGKNGLTTAQIVTSLGISPHSALDKLRRCRGIVCEKPDKKTNLWKAK